MPRPGDTIDGKYAIIRVLGTGGMGVVYEAEHLRLKQRCAIKMLSPEMLRESDIVSRFEREARASALLKSPHVTRVTDVATTKDGVPYIVMELMSGRDLDGELQARGMIPYHEAVDYILQACAAVGEAHAAGIIHRDLKPGNLFLAREPDDGRVLLKVLDFGISKMIDEESKLTSAGMTMGTALYMSPEQLRSAAKVDARSDIWSLGIILYELVCGSPPFVGSAPQIAAAIVSEDAPDITMRCPIPPPLGAIIHRALRRAPEERFQNIAEMAVALSPFCAENSIGRAVVSQITKRSSSRNLQGEKDRSTEHRASSPSSPIDVEARTLVHDVSTSAPHSVDTAAQRHSASRRLLIAALVVVGVVGAAGIVVVLFVALRVKSPSVSPTLGNATANTTASAAPPDPSDTAAGPAHQGTPPAIAAEPLAAGADAGPVRPVVTLPPLAAHPARPPATSGPAATAPSASHQTPAKPPAVTTGAAPASNPPFLN